MKTKALLILGSIHLFSVLPSVAQVHRPDAVGFVNLLLLPGYNLVANQLNATPNNHLSNVLTGLPPETQVLRFDNAVNNYEIELFDGETWIKPDGSPGTLTANPGSGMFVFNPESQDIILTLVGEVPHGEILSVAIPSGFSMISSILPRAIALTRENGFPLNPESQVIFWDPITQNYREPIIRDFSGWIQVDGTPIPPPTVEVGQGFFVYNSGQPTFWSMSNIGE